MDGRKFPREPVGRPYVADGENWSFTEDSPSWLSNSQSNSHVSDISCILMSVKQSLVSWFAISDITAFYHRYFAQKTKASCPDQFALALLSAAATTLLHFRHDVEPESRRLYSGNHYARAARG